MIFNTRVVGLLKRHYYLYKNLPQVPAIHIRSVVTTAEISEKMAPRGNSLSALVDSLRGFADERLAESWDNVGLLVEPYSPVASVSDVLFTNDLTEGVLKEALKLQVQLIISYHPPIFAPLKRITNSSWKERIIGACLENRIAIYSPHTAWDAVSGGVADWLGFAFNGSSTSSVPIVPSTLVQSCKTLSVISDQKTIIKTLETAKDLVKMYDAFHALMSSKNDEYCLSIFTESEDQLREALPNAVVPSEKAPSDICAGMGRLFTINNITLNECIQRVKSHTGLQHVRLALGCDHTLSSEIRSIALVPGSGGSLLKGVKADLYITGEMFHHDVLEANHKGTSVILTNHSDSERGFLKHVKLWFEMLHPDVQFHLSTADHDPLSTY